MTPDGQPVSTAATYLPPREPGDRGCQAWPDLGAPAHRGGMELGEPESERPRWPTPIRSPRTWCSMATAQWPPRVRCPRRSVVGDCGPSANLDKQLRSSQHGGGFGQPPQVPAADANLEFLLLEHLRSDDVHAIAMAVLHTLKAMAPAVGSTTTSRGGFASIRRRTPPGGCPTSRRCSTTTPS